MSAYGEGGTCPCCMAFSTYSNAALNATNATDLTDAVVFAVPTANGTINATDATDAVVFPLAARVRLHRGGGGEPCNSPPPAQKCTIMI